MNNSPQDLTQEEINSFLAMNIEQEYQEISQSLDKYHAIFYQIWEMGYPRLSFEVPTAAVVFDKKGKNIEFLFNPIFWKNSDRYSKEFVICHECLHVLLNHGIRIKDLKNNKTNLLVANNCLDVVINHMLVDRFGFDRKSIQNQEKYCWIDTVFADDHKKVEKNRAFEYYYGLLKNKILDNLRDGKLQIKNDDGSISDIDAETVDAHDFLDSIEDENLKNKVAEEINKKINELDKKDLVEKIGRTGEGAMHLNDKKSGSAGEKSAGILHRIVTPKKVKKKRWESVIKKWSMRYKTDDHSIEQWVKQNRRTELLDNDLLLPSDHDEEYNKNDRIQVFFFLDTSGSCIGLKDRFFKAAESLPDDKFIIKLFCFDTKVFDLDINQKQVYGGGGTQFQILETRIQQEMKKIGCKYPEAVFVISDGYSTDTLRTMHPKKWYWFLTTNYKHCIPRDSNIYNLNNFE